MPSTNSTAIVGELERTPFAHILVYAFDRRLTGVLFLRDPSGDPHIVAFARGAPAPIRSADECAALERLLVEAGILAAGEIRAALPGELSVTTGLPPDEPPSQDGLPERGAPAGSDGSRFFKRMVRLFGLPAATTYKYIEGGTAWSGGIEPSGVDPQALLWAGLREHAHVSTKMAAALSRLGDLPLRIPSGAVLDRFGFTPAELAVTSRIRERALPLCELIASGVAPAGVIRGLVYMLLLTRHLDFGHELSRVDAPESTPVPASVRLAGPNREAVSERSGGSADAPVPVALGRVQLRTVTQRAGAAAPDPPGDGEPGSQGTRVGRRGASSCKLS